MELGTLIFGGICGAFYAGVIGMIYIELRIAEVKKGQKDRQLDKFGDESHPRLTANKIMRESQQAALTYFLLLVGLVLFLIAYPAVTCFVLNALKLLE